MASKYNSCESAQDVKIKGEDAVLCMHPANCYFKRERMISENGREEMKQICIKERDNE